MCMLVHGGASTLAHHLTAHMRMQIGGSSINYCFGDAWVYDTNSALWEHAKLTYGSLMFCPQLRNLPLSSGDV